jgi:hypothetical protein
LSGLPYGYAANSPTNLSDPTGLCPGCPGFLRSFFGGMSRVSPQVGSPSVQNLGFKSLYSTFTKFAIQITKRRRTHILYGDSTGGGHAAEANLAGVRGPEGPHQFVILPNGKSYFDSGLSHERIIQELLRIANDPSSYATGRIPKPRKNKKGGLNRPHAFGMVGNQPTKVVVEPGGEGIITAYPQARPNPKAQPKGKK